MKLEPLEKTRSVQAVALFHPLWCLKSSHNLMLTLLKEPLIGRPACQSVSMVLASVRVPSEMGLLCVTDGPLLRYIVPTECGCGRRFTVENSTEVAFPLSATMNSDLTASLLIEVCSGVAVGTSIMAVEWRGTVGAFH